MRARRFRPSFDALALRITPTDLVPVVGIAPSPMLLGAGTMPGERSQLDDWCLEPEAPINLEEPEVDPTKW